MKGTCVFIGLFFIFSHLAAMDPPEGEYRYELNVRIKSGNSLNHKCGNYFEFYVTYSGSSEKMLKNQDLNAIGVDENWRDCPAYVFYEKASLQLMNYRFYGKRKWRNAFGCKGKGKESDRFTFPVSTYPCGTVIIDDKIPKWDSYATLNVRPKEINLYYHDYKGTYKTTALTLLDKKKITLKATKGYAASAYAWQYAVKSRSSSEAWENVAWKAVPSSLYNGSVATFSGNDLMGEEAFRAVLKEKKVVAIKIAGCTESPLMLLDPRLYAPKLVRTEIETPSCSYSNDGKIKVYFDRSLLTGEMVEIVAQKWEENKLTPSSPTINTFALGSWVGIGSIQLKAGESSGVIQGLPSGKYKIQISQGAYPDDYPSYVADATDHELGNIEVGSVRDPELETITAVNADCYGGKNGQITVKATGGKGNLYLLYTPTDSLLVSREKSESVAGLKAEEYSIRLHGANGCTARENNKEKIWKIKVGQPSNPVKVEQLSDPVNPTGYGLSNGSISVVASGGSGGYTYEWKKDNSLLSSLTGSNSSSLGKGVYTVTVRDALYNSVQPSTAENTAGCIASVNITLTQPDLLCASVTQTKAVTCYGTPTAVIEASGTGGVPPYTYQWQKQSGGTWSNLNCTTRDCPDIGAGSYRVRLRDKNNNEAYSSVFVVKEPAALTIAFSTVLPTCNGDADGQVKAIVRGGTSPYFYLWTFGRETTESIIVEAGEYHVLVTDNNGCQTANSVTLSEPLPVTATAKVELPSRYDASDGQITIYPAGGTPYGDGSYRYLWDYHGETTNPLANLSADSVPYRVVVSDAHHCEVELSPRMIYPLEVRLGIADSISCAGQEDGRLKAIATGGVSTNYRYHWIRLTDEKEETLEGDDSLSVAVGTGYYRVSVYDSENNMAADTLFFPEPDTLHIRLIPRHLLCKYDMDGEITTCVSGGTEPYFYRWSGKQRTSRVTHLAEGLYRVDVRDWHGCDVWDTVSILSPDELIVTPDFIPPLGYGRSDGTVWTKVTGGVSPYHYQWLGNLNDTTYRVESVSAGEYEVEITDKHECKKRTAVTVTQPPLLEAFITQTAIVSCKGRHDARLEASAQGGVSNIYRFNWYTLKEGRGTELCSGVVASGLPAGRYRLKVTDENGIEAWATEYEVTEPDELTVNVQGNEIACNGGTEGEIKAFVTGGTPPYRYFWTSGDTTAIVKGLTDGAYLVLVSDAHDCREEALGEIVVPGGLEVKEEVCHPICHGNDNGTIRININGGIAPYGIRWQDTENPALFRDSLSAGIYKVNITDAHGCFKNLVYKLIDPSPLEVDLGYDRTLCRGQLCELRNLKKTKEPVLWRWYRDGVLIDSRSLLLTAKQEGLYRLEIKDTDGCSGSGEVTIRQQETDIDVNFAMASEVKTGDVLKLVNTTIPAPERWEWLIPEIPEIQVLSMDVTAEMLIDLPGRYTMGLRSIIGECEAVLYKEVIVTEQNTDDTEPRPFTRRIQEINVWPNPNNGQFRVRIELNNIAPIRLFLYTQNGTLIKQLSFEGEAIYEWSQESFLPLGMYIIQVICEKERQTVKVMVEP